jgi:hypothetical protein
MGLGHWDITVVFGRTDKRAACIAIPEYYEAVLHLDLERIKDDDLEGFVVHELQHCHNWMVFDLLEHLATTACERRIVEFTEERMTTDVERAWLRMGRMP